MLVECSAISYLNGASLFWTYLCTGRSFFLAGSEVGWWGGRGLFQFFIASLFSILIVNLVFCAVFKSSQSGLYLPMYVMYIHVLRREKKPFWQEVLLSTKWLELSRGLWIWRFHLKLRVPCDFQPSWKYELFLFSKENSSLQWGLNLKGRGNVTVTFK